MSNEKVITVKTNEVIDFYKMLENAKISSLGIDDMMAVVKNMRELKKIVVDFDALRDEVISKAKDADFNKNVAERNKLKEEKSTAKVLKRLKELEVYFMNFHIRCVNALDSDFRKENELTVRKLTSDGLEKLLSGNEFTVTQAMKITEFFGDE